MPQLLILITLLATISHFNYWETVEDKTWVHHCVGFPIYGCSSLIIFFEDSSGEKRAIQQKRGFGFYAVRTSLYRVHLRGDTLDLVEGIDIGNIIEDSESIVFVSRVLDENVSVILETNPEALEALKEIEHNYITPAHDLPVIKNMGHRDIDLVRIKDEIKLRKL